MTQLTLSGKPVRAKPRAARPTSEYPAGYPASEERRYRRRWDTDKDRIGEW